MTLSDAHKCDLFRMFVRRDWINMMPQAYAPLVGDRICPPVIRSAVSEGTGMNDTLTASLMLLQRRMRFDRIGIYVSTAGGAGAEARLGIYNVGLDYYPTTLILDAGTVDCTSTGSKEISIDLTLNRGWYALVFNCNDGTIGFYYTSSHLSPLGSTRAYPYTAHGWEVAYPYGSLPDTFPAGGTRIGTRWMTLRVAELL